MPVKRQDLAMDYGAVKGFREDRSGQRLLRVLLLHFGCGRLLHETALRARWAEVADPSAVGLWKRLKICNVLAACSLRRVVPGAGVERAHPCDTTRASASRPSREPPEGCLTRYPEMVPRSRNRGRRGAA